MSEKIYYLLIKNCPNDGGQLNTEIIKDMELKIRIFDLPSVKFQKDEIELLEDETYKNTSLVVPRFFALTYYGEYSFIFIYGNNAQNTYTIRSVDIETNSNLGEGSGSTEQDFKNDIVSIIKKVVEYND